MFPLFESADDPEVELLKWRLWHGEILPQTLLDVQQHHCSVVTSALLTANHQYSFLRILGVFRLFKVLATSVMIMPFNCVKSFISLEQWQRPKPFCQINWSYMYLP